VKDIDDDAEGRKRAEEGRVGVVGGDVWVAAAVEALRGPVLSGESTGPDHCLRRE
jgi:hypothetical protein